MSTCCQCGCTVVRFALCVLNTNASCLRLRCAVCNRDRQTEVKIANGVASFAVRDHTPAGVPAVTDHDRALRDLSGQPLNADSDRDHGGVNGRHPVGSSLGMRLRGGGLVLGGKGESSYFLALLI